METRYEITLTDGTVLSNLLMNGNNYVSQNKITHTVFDNNLSLVTITETNDNTTTEITYDELELIHCTDYEDGTYFTLREIPSLTLELRNMKSDIEFLNMMNSI